jgi:apolipoprotein N-acyltransferase
LLLAGLAAVVCSQAFAPRPYWFLAFVAVGAFLRLVLGARLKVAVLCGFLFGATFFIFTITWVFYVMRVHGGLSVVEAAGVMSLIVIGFGIYKAVFAACVNLIGVRSVGLALFFAPFFWIVLEWTRTHFPIIGFPWNCFGYALVDQFAVLQLASVSGIYGLSFLVVGVAAVFVWTRTSARRSRTGRALEITVLLALVFVFMVLPRYLPDAPWRYWARLVQPNFPQEPSYSADWLEQHAADLDELERLSTQKPAQAEDVQLLMWPEVPAPFSLQDARFAQRAQRIARTGERHFLLGVIEWRASRQGRMEPYNSAALLGPAGERTFTYDKIHLVPFGEYVPFRNWLRFADKLTAQVGDFRPGTEYRIGEVPDLPGAMEFRQPGPPRKFSVLICYEAVFPAMARRFVLNGAELLVNISNDAWFGHTQAPAGHLAMARVRAVENRRWLLRPTNNGHTVSIDPYGSVLARLPQDVRGVLRAPYDFRTQRTVYTRCGDWLVWLGMAVSGGLLLFGLRRERKM